MSKNEYNVYLFQVKYYASNNLLVVIPNDKKVE